MANALKAVGVGMVILLAVVIIPVLITAEDGVQTTTVEIEEGQTIGFSTALDLTATDVSNNQVTLVLTSQQTGDTANVTLSGGESQPLMIDNSTVTATLQRSQAGIAIVTVDYSPTAFWSGEGRVLIDHMDLLLASLAFIIVLSLLAVMVKA